MHAVVVLVVKHRAQDAGGFELSKIVVAAGHASAQHDGRDLVVGQHPAAAAHRVLAVQITRRLGLADRVVARPQVGKLVAAVGQGGGGDADGHTQVIGARQGDGGTANAGLARALHAVVVLVLKHRTQDAGGLQLTEVVVHAGHTGRQRDGRDLVVADRAARAAGAVLAVQITRRLGLVDGVVARAQAVEGVAAVGCGGGGGRDGLAQVIGAGQGDCGTGDAKLASALDAVVVAVLEHAAGDGRAGLELAKVHARGCVPRVQHDAADLVVGDGAAGVAGAVFAVQITRRLALGDGIGAGSQVDKLVVAVGVGQQRGRDRLAQVIGAGDRDGGTRNAGFTRTLHAVVVLVVKHRAQDAGGFELSKIVVAAGHASAQHDGRDLVVGQHPAAAAHRVLAVQITRRLGLADRVVARPQVGKLVAAVGQGGGGGCHGLATVVGAGQADGGTGDAQLTRTLDAVVVAVSKHHAGDAGGLDLAEVVVVADEALRQRDVADDIVAGRATAVQAGGVDAVQLAGRLGGLGHAVGARAQADEDVGAIGCGHRAGAHRDATVVHTAQIDSDAAQAHFSRLLGAVVVVVAEHGAADLRTHQLAEVVVDAVVASGQHHIADDIVDRRAATVAAGRVLAVQVGAGLRFTDRVGASRQAGERIKARRVGDSAGTHRMAQVVHTGQGDGDTGQRWFTRAAHPVVAKVFIHIPRHAGIGRFGHQAGVQRLVGLASGQCHHMAQAGQRVGVTVQRVLAVAVGIGGGEVVGRGNELDLVVTRMQAGKLVEAMLDCRSAVVVAGDGAGNQLAGGVIQLHDHLVDPGLAAVLQAVAIAI